MPDSTTGAVVDLRSYAPRERHEIIHTVLDRLHRGDTIRFVNDHRPSPLRYELNATRPGELEWVDDVQGPDVWSWSLTSQVRVLDVRPKLAAGEEPFATIMETVAQLDPDEPLVVVAPFEPVPLEGVLSGQGFAFKATPQDGGDWRVRFWRETV